MKVSLIVPAFNEEKFIGQLLDSILAQTYQPDEIIICDNKSTDKTVEVIQQFQSILPIKIVFEKQKGIRFAVETAWKSASGDLIIRTDADCVLPKNWIKKIIKHFEIDSDLIACGGGAHASDGNIIIRFLTPLVAELNRLILLIVKGHLVLFGANFAIKKDALISINGYQTTQETSQDDILISEKLAHNKLKYRYFLNNYNYTSTRRFNNFNNIAMIILSIFVSKFYLEKSN